MSSIKPKLKNWTSKEPMSLTNINMKLWTLNFVSWKKWDKIENNNHQADKQLKRAWIFNIVHVGNLSIKYFLCTQKLKSNVWLVGRPKAFNTWCYLSKAQNISSSANLSYQRNVEDFIGVKCTSFLNIVKKGDVSMRLQ